MIALLLSALLTTSSALADGVQVRVEAINAVTKTPMYNFDVQLHPLKHFDIQSTQLRTNRFGIATMTAPRPDEYMVLIAPTSAAASAQIQCATVTVKPNQPLTVKFEIGTDVPINRTCEFMKTAAPPATPTIRAEAAPPSILNVTF